MVLILMAYMLCGFSFSAFGAECSVPVCLSNIKYRYQSKEYVDHCNINGIKCSYNTIFVSDLKYLWNHTNPANTSNMFPAKFKKIKHLPVDLFVNGFKAGDSLFTITDFFVGNNMDSSIEDEESVRVFKAIISFDGEIKRQAVESHIKKYPFVYEYRSDNLQKKQEFENIKAECIADGRLALVGGQFIHGPNGYFGPEEYNSIVWEDRKKTLISCVPIIIGAGSLFGGYLLLSKYDK